MAALTEERARGGVSWEIKVGIFLIAFGKLQAEEH